MEVYPGWVVLVQLLGAHCKWSGDESLFLVRSGPGTKQISVVGLRFGGIRSEARFAARLQTVDSTKRNAACITFAAVQKRLRTPP